MVGRCVMTKMSGEIEWGSAVDGFVNLGHMGRLADGNIAEHGK